MEKIIGTKISGDGRGEQLGFPTINVNIGEKREEGVFAGKIFLKNLLFHCMVHIGPRPTFHSDEFRVEIFVLGDFSEKISDGVQIEFELIEKIRGVKKFSSSVELVEQIEQDKQQALKIFL